MINNCLKTFVDDVVRFHELATGLKSLTSHDQIVAYGQSKGYDFSKSEWIVFFKSDFDLQSESLQQLVLSANPTHWSWAFRQHSVWRAMLMEGAADGAV